MNRLPNETLHFIASKLDRASLKSLCEVSHRSNAISTPFLFQSLALRTTELDISSLTFTLETIALRHLAYTKHISIEAPFHARLYNRCPHYDDPRASGNAVMRVVDGLGSDDSDNLGPFFDFKCNLDMILDSVPDNKLESFSWNLGTCLPDHLIWGSFSGFHKQTKIKSISLITDDTCGTNVDTQYFVDLAHFKELESLTWRGLSGFDAFNAVKKCIDANGETLTSLALDLVSWDGTATGWRKSYASQIPTPTTFPENFFASNVLGVETGQARQRLPSLERLALWAMSFQSASIEMALAFNFPRLRQLELWNCSHSLSLLRSVVETGQKMTLKSFKFTIDFCSTECQGTPATDCDAILSCFLKSFRGLEDLHLMLSQPVDWAVVCSGALNHSSTLRSFLSHYRTEEDTAEFGNDRPISWTDEMGHLCGSKTLLGVGLSVPPLVLLQQWKTQSSKPTSCKVLHLRSSGVKISDSDVDRSDIETKLLEKPAVQGFLQLADWAFNADGLQTLQILAWGDFSFDGRFANQQLVFCRDGDSFRPLRRADPWFQDALNDHMDLLSACCSNSIIE